MLARQLLYFAENLGAATPVAACNAAQKIVTAQDRQGRGGLLDEVQLMIGQRERSHSISPR